jgi:NADPH:quinone reductase-like Zn-dependent oxidoreductase
MRAAVLTGYGDVDKLEIREVPEPEPGPGEMKVRVAGSSINPIDYGVRSGRMQLDDERDLERMRKVDAIANAMAGSIEKLLGKVKPGGTIGSVTGEPDAGARLPAR